MMKADRRIAESAQQMVPDPSWAGRGRTAWGAGASACWAARLGGGVGWGGDGAGWAGSWRGVRWLAFGCPLRQRLLALMQVLPQGIPFLQFFASASEANRMKTKSQAIRSPQG